MASQTAPRASLSPELTSRRESQGVCSCGFLRDLNDCDCEWGAMTRAMIRIGYQADPQEAAQALSVLLTEWMSSISEHRRKLLQTQADSWIGSKKAFQEHFGISTTTYDKLRIKLRSS